MEPKQNKIVIIGSGPTGIGAAYHLFKRGYTHWQLFEKHSYAGGHSATHVDEQGFLWDEGGHVLFSHFPYYDQFVKEVLQEDYFEHQRESWIKLSGNVWVPYPFQNNIKYLSPEDQFTCIKGLLDAQHKANATPSHFSDWINQVFGEGIGELFMRPYNFKVWATPATLMSHTWIGERVSVVDLKMVLENLILNKDDVAWGPNNKFIFPKYGGTGGIYERASKLFADRISYGKTIKHIDAGHKLITFQDGGSESYDYLISAMPIDKLYSMVLDAPPDKTQKAQRLVHNNILIVGIGLEKRIETSKCWVYFPERQTPFYRLTYFHNYSPFNVPQGAVDRYASLMCEISYSEHKPYDASRAIDDTIDSLIANGILEDADRAKIISRVVYDIPYAYPIPTLDRDTILEQIQPWLMEQGIYSRGRFGAWKYEISNMDHCFMQGVEAVERILSGAPEKVLN